MRWRRGRRCVCIIIVISAQHRLTRPNEPWPRGSAPYSYNTRTPSPPPPQRLQRPPQRGAAGRGVDCRGRRHSSSSSSSNSGGGFGGGTRARTSPAAHVDVHCPWPLSLRALACRDNNIILYCRRRRRHSARPWTTRRSHCSWRSRARSPSTRPQPPQPPHRSATRTTITWSSRSTARCGTSPCRPTSWTGRTSTTAWRSRRPEDTTRPRWYRWTWRPGSRCPVAVARTAVGPAEGPPDSLREEPVERDRGREDSAAAAAVSTTRSTCRSGSAIRWGLRNPCDNAGTIISWRRRTATCIDTLACGRRRHGLRPRRTFGGLDPPSSSSPTYGKFCTTRYNTV